MIALLLAAWAFAVEPPTPDALSALITSEQASFGADDADGYVALLHPDAVKVLSRSGPPAAAVKASWRDLKPLQAMMGSVSKIRVAAVVMDGDSRAYAVIDEPGNPPMARAVAWDGEHWKLALPTFVPEFGYVLPPTGVTVQASADAKAAFEALDSGRKVMFSNPGKYSTSVEPKSVDALKTAMIALFRQKPEIVANMEAKVGPLDQLTREGLFTLMYGHFDAQTIANLKLEHALLGELPQQRGMLLVYRADMTLYGNPGTTKILVAHQVPTEAGWKTDMSRDVEKMSGEFGKAILNAP